MPQEPASQGEDGAVARTAHLPVARAESEPASLVGADPGDCLDLAVLATDEAIGVVGFEGARWLAVGEIDASQAHAGAAPKADVIEDVLAEELPFPRARDRVVAEFERRYVARVLANNGGSVPRAARASGIARRYFNLILARNR